MSYSPIWGEFAKKYGYDPQSFNGSLPAYMKFRDQWWNKQRSQMPTSGGFLSPFQHGTDNQGNVWPPQQLQNQQQLLGGSKLANIADILRKQQSAKTPPAMPAKPSVSGIAPVAPVNYVQNDRLNQGKGWSKFKNQARGTDQFKMVNDIINQYFK